MTVVVKMHKNVIVYRSYDPDSCLLEQRGKLYLFHRLLHFHAGSDVLKGSFRIASIRAF